MAETERAWSLPSDEGAERPVDAAATVLDAVDRPGYVCDRRRGLVAWNDRFRDAVGATDEELAGAEPTAFVAEGDLPRARETLARVADGEEVTVELALSVGDGARVRELTARPLAADGEVWGLVATVREQTGRTAGDRPARTDRADLLERLHEGTRDLMAAEDVVGVAERAADIAQRHFGFATAAVRLLRGDALEIAAVSSEAEPFEEYPSFDVGEGFVGETYERGEPAVYADLAAVDTDFDYGPMRSAIVLPIDGWGVLGIAATERDAFDETDLELARLFAADVERAFERADREQRLRAQKADLEQYETLVETMSDGVYMTDADHRLTAVNDALVEMVGGDREELLGTRVAHALGDQRGLEAGDELRARLRSGERSVVTYETTLQTDDGALPVENRFSLLPGEGFSGTVGVFRDVTERKEREEELEELTERLDLALEGAELGVWDWNPQTNEVRFDERWAGMLGYSKAELDPEYETWAELVHPDDLERAEADIAAHLEGETEYYQSDYRMRTRDGDWKWIRDVGRVFERDEEGEPVRAVGIHQDVTEEKERERELTEITERLNLALEGGELGVWDWDVETDDLAVDERWAAQLGYAPDELEPTMGTWESMVHPEDLPRVEERLAAHIEGETELYQCEYRIETRDGDWKWIRSIGEVFERDEEGEPVRAVGIHQDVTERKRQEEQLRTQRDELETLNRINDLVQETIAALAAAASREEIEEIVCERLGGSALYRFAFIGTSRPGDGTVTPRAWAGAGADYLDEVEIPADADAAGAGPAARTFETGETTVVHDVESDPLCEPFREAALAYGFQSVAVVPFTNDGVVHGVLVVYADRTGAFSPREVQAFEVLGEMVGHTISATQDRRLLEADARVELTFRIVGEGAFLGAVADRLDCTCRLLDSVTTAENGTLHYVAVEADAAAVEAVATDRDDVTDLRHVQTDGGTAVFEVRLRESVASLLRESGVRPVEIAAESGQIRAVGEAPRDADVRGVTQRLGACGDVSLVSKQESDRWQSDAERGPDLLHRLTERQHAALTAAYFGGYFDWPRDSTAEDVAAALGISSPTFHQHLRHAQRKLLTTVLGDRT